jgi:glycosyltransferase involved in cell wall biosynthesis
MTGKRSESFTEGGTEVRVVGIRNWRRAIFRVIEFWLKSILLMIRVKANIYIASDLYSLPNAFIAGRLNKAWLVYDSRELYSNIAALANRRFAQRVWDFIERVLIKRVDATITVNESISEIISRIYGIPRPIVLMNCPFYQEVKRTNLLREICQIPETKKVVLYQGGLQRGRGISRLIDLIQTLPECVLILMGDGPLKKELAAKIETLQGKVYLVDAVPVDRLLHHTASADVGICMIEYYGLSYYLSLPNKLFEYVMAGVPVVASDFPEMRRIVSEYRIGETANPTDVIEIAEKIRKLLEPERHDETAENCKSAAKKLNWESESAKLVHLIDSLGTAHL